MSTARIRRWQHKTVEEGKEFLRKLIADNRKYEDLTAEEKDFLQAIRESHAAWVQDMAAERKAIADGIKGLDAQRMQSLKATIAAFEAGLLNTDQMNEREFKWLQEIARQLKPPTKH